MKDKDLLKLFLRNGWQEFGVKGSHHKVRKGERVEIIPFTGERCARAFERDIETQWIEMTPQRRENDDFHLSRIGA